MLDSHPQFECPSSVVTDPSPLIVSQISESSGDSPAIMDKYAMSKEFEAVASKVCINANNETTRDEGEMSQILSTNDFQLKRLDGPKKETIVSFPQSSSTSDSQAVSNKTICQEQKQSREDNEYKLIKSSEIGKCPEGAQKKSRVIVGVIDSEETAGPFVSNTVPSLKNNLQESTIDEVTLSREGSEDAPDKFLRDNSIERKAKKPRSSIR
ncbi:unnamed protein product [Protopolystoma xenopodis]|uniref:Uncharacterized protein n=1 Tax=Protopolystoma xenopodis TaxID=117903 RepID=A0A448XM28_9PLAT|nr:unnamed protein product [Protopolystoma xenopodis]